MDKIIYINNKTGERMPKNYPNSTAYIIMSEYLSLAELAAGGRNPEEQKFL